MSKKTFRKALNQLDLHKKTKEPEIPGILGFTVNNVQVVSVPYRPGYVYVRLRNNISEVIQAYNSDVPTTYDLPVVITRDEVDKSRYKVKGRDLGVYQNWGSSNAYVANHTHSFFQGFLAFDDAVFLATGVALDFKEDIYGSAAGTTISVGVVTGTFSRAGHTHPNTNIVIYDDGVFKATGTAIDFGANINVAVTGTTLYVSSIDTVGGGGGGSGLLIFDNSVFKVTGTAIDFGDNLSVAVTGTYVYVTAVGVTGSAGAPGSPGDNTLLLYDDNTFKVTGTAIHFNDNLSVITSGSHAWVNGLASGGGGGGNRFLIAETNPTGVTGTTLTLTGAYDTIELEYVARSTAAVTNTSMYMFFNGDNTQANYRRTRDGGFGAGSAQTSGGDDAFIAFVAGANSGANDCGSGFIRIVNYAESYFNKQSNSLYSTRMDTSSNQVYVQIVGHNWENTAPITDITFALAAGNFATGSNFRVYGIPSTQSQDSSLLIYDDSVFKVTGTAISFDSNLSVSVTGTTAFVSGVSGGRTLIAETFPTTTGTSFTSIPNTYETLLLDYVARGSDAFFSVAMYCYLNGDFTASNYRYQNEIASGASVTTGGGDAANVATVPSSLASANECVSGEIQITKYAGVSFNKQIKSLSQYRTAATSEILNRYAISWENASAVDRIDLVLNSGVFVSGSCFRLYGLS